MCRVNIGHLRLMVTVCHCVGSLEVIIGSILVNLGPGHFISQLWVGKGYLMVTVGQQG